MTTNPPVEFDDPETIVIGALSTVLDPIPVCAEVPNPRPKRFVTVEIVGGHDRTIVTERVRMGVHCWGESRTDAHDIATLARTAVRQLRSTVTGGTSVYRVAIVGRPAPLPDPVSGQPRFRFLAELDFRGHDTGDAGS